MVSNFNLKGRYLTQPVMKILYLHLIYKNNAIFV